MYTEQGHTYIKKHVKQWLGKYNLKQLTIFSKNVNAVLIVHKHLEVLNCIQIQKQKLYTFQLTPYTW